MSKKNGTPHSSYPDIMRPTMKNVDTSTLKDPQGFFETFKDAGFHRFGGQGLDLKNFNAAAVADQRYLSEDFRASIKGVLFTSKSHQFSVAEFFEEFFGKPGEDENSIRCKQFVFDNKILKQNFHFAETSYHKKNAALTESDKFAMYTSWRPYRGIRLPHHLNPARQHDPLAEIGNFLHSSDLSPILGPLWDKFYRPYLNKSLEEIWVTFNPPLQSADGEITIYGFWVHGHPTNVPFELHPNYNSEYGTIVTENFISPFSTQSWYNPAWGTRLEGSMFNKFFAKCERAYMHISQYKCQRLGYQESVGQMRFDFYYEFDIMKRCMCAVDTDLAGYSWWQTFGSWNLTTFYDFYTTCFELFLYLTGILGTYYLSLDSLKIPKLNNIETTLTNIFKVTNNLENIFSYDMTWILASVSTVSVFLIYQFILFLTPPLRIGLFACYALALAAISVVILGFFISCTLISVTSWLKTKWVIILIYIFIWIPIKCLIAICMLPLWLFWKLSIYLTWPLVLLWTFISAIGFGLAVILKLFLEEHKSTSTPVDLQLSEIPEINDYLNFQLTKLSRSSVSIANPYYWLAIFLSPFFINVLIGKTLIFGLLLQPILGVILSSFCTWYLCVIDHYWSTVLEKADNTWKWILDFEKRFFFIKRTRTWLVYLYRKFKWAKVRCKKQIKRNYLYSIKFIFFIVLPWVLTRTLTITYVVLMLIFLINLGAILYGPLFF